VAGASQSVQVVSDLMTALMDGRVEDALALVDQRVVWQPATRPGLSLYHGHTGTIQMLTDLRGRYHSFRLEVQDIAVDADTATGSDTDAQVRMRARLVAETDQGEAALPLIRSIFTVRMGRVTSVESQFE
jgi:limonene-1,2-epoxide hydrolase